MQIKKVLYLFLCLVYLSIPVSAAAYDSHTHSFVDELIEPTCYSEGTYRRICSVCGEQDGETIILPKKNHTFGKWCSDLPSRCFSAGRQVRVCEVCGKRDYREIPANNKHRPIRQFNFPATEFSDGETTIICRDCNTKLSKEIYPRLAEISLTKSRYEKTGKKIKPKIKALDSQGNLIDKKNYKIKYEKAPKSIGTHYLTVKFKNHYSGSYKLSYSIVPEKPVQFTLKLTEKSAIIKYKKCSGVQVRYSDNKSFKNSVKLNFNGKKSKLSVTALNGNKTYYFKIREYKSVNGKVYYSPWSKVKTVRT